MTQTDQLDQLFGTNNGIVKTAQVMELGIPKYTFYNYTKQNNIEQVAHGVYMTEDAWKDGMYLLHLRCQQAVFSHESALFLHDMTDREPSTYSITVKTGYNPFNLKADGIKVYTLKEDLYNVGIETARTPFGNEVLVYDPERTICDIVRSRSGIEVQTLQDALKSYVRRKDTNFVRLMSYAGMFHVDKLLRNYIGMIL